jgi:hypothetical protein
MKPYVTTHDDPAAPLKYALRDDAEIVLATIPMLNLKTACADFNRVLQLAPQKRNRIAHVTLSLPAGARLDTRDWQRVVRHGLAGLGLEIDRHPVVVTRHRGTSCDHIHIVASRVSWLGDVTTLDLEEVTSARVHVDLATRLGLSEPEYPVLAPSPRLASRVPARKKAPEVRALHDAVATVLVRFRPQSTQDLDRHLAATGFRIASRDVGGKSLPTFLRKDGTPFRRSDLKPDLTSYALLGRLAHVKALDDATRIISTSLLVRAIDRPVIHHLKALIHARNTDNSNTTDPRRNSVKPDRGADDGRATVASAARSVGGGENRRAIGHGRGFDRNPEIALHNHDRNGRHDAGDRRQNAGFIARDQRDQGSTADPARLTYGTWLRHLLSAVRSARTRIQFVIVRPGTARISFGDNIRAVLDGQRLRLSAGGDKSRDAHGFMAAFPAGFLTKSATSTGAAPLMSHTNQDPEFHVDPGMDPRSSVEDRMRAGEGNEGADETYGEEGFDH